MIFKNCDFHDTKFANIDSMDVVFENYDFSNANLNQSSIHRTEFKNCKLVGIDLTESRLGNVWFPVSTYQAIQFASLLGLVIVD
ncbi:pentapeptide repeat-containing protein [Halalkalibacter lacteus]|uniref:pentapeptide repeat-containing protein n=1 Tax=Halalkalibacter lacteus TaxID=3090663 RepID=UPI003D67194F